MFSLIASGIIIGSASYSDEFREMVKNNSYNAYLKCSEYCNYFYSKFFPKIFSQTCLIDSLYYILMNKENNKIIIKRKIEDVNYELSNKNLKKDILSSLNILKNEIKNEIKNENNEVEFNEVEFNKVEFNKVEFNEYLLINYSLNDNYSDKSNNYKSITKINFELSFLDKILNPDKTINTLISCNYNDIDITDLVQEYSGPNGDFFGDLDFRIILDDNLDLVYTKSCNNINIINNKLDLYDIYLDKINFNCINLLQK